jgi:protein gp37
MQLTAIEWTDYSANPLKFRDADGKIVWGCVHASPGCVNCYAETLAKRYGRGGPFNVQTMNGLTPYLDEAELRKMLTYKPASGKRCFVGDMTDVFGPWVPDELLDRLFTTFAQRPDVTWQVLTKRADRMRDFLSDGGRAPTKWPLPNVWLGVSCEDQKRADERIPLLLATPAAVRFISAEPLLGGIDIAKHRPGALGLHWVIIGGESGPQSRDCQTWWIENLIGQCRDADVAPFVKQLGSKPVRSCSQCVKDIGRSVMGGFVDACGPTHATLIAELVRVRAHKGSLMSEWPEALRVREFPRGLDVLSGDAGMTASSNQSAGVPSEGS